MLNLSGKPSSDYRAIMPYSLVTILLSLVVFARANDNGVGRTPAMGYNTWNDFRCDISAADIKGAADAIVRQGLDKLGYEYVNMDDCWAKGRNADGSPYPDPSTFPQGIKDVADYVHSKGLKFGIYSDRGTLTCAGRPGSQNYEKIDAQTYASWGVDYLKEDSCYAPQDHQQAFTQYGLMRDALNATGRRIYFSLCGWNSWYAPQGWTLGNSWRIAGDCNTWPNVLNAIDTNAPLAQYARPGGWNDPDMLIGSNNKTAAHLSATQSRTMFSMWAVMAAPLLIGSNINNLNSWDLETYSNSEVIAVDQDPLGLQGMRLVGGNLIQNPVGPSYNIWGRKLSGGNAAIIFLNNANNAQTLTCDATCLSKLGFTADQRVAVRDLWQHKDLGVITVRNGYSTQVSGAGGSAIFKFSTDRKSVV